MTDENNKDSLPDFSGKVVWLELRGSSDPAGILLEYAEFAECVGRMFLRGRMATFIEGWLAGVEAHVAWQDVVHYLVFPSADDYRKRAATYKGKRGMPLFRRDT